MIQRVPPAVAAGAAATEPIEIVAALASIASLAGQVHSGGSGKLSYSSTTADRISEHTQPKTNDYEKVCLDIGFAAPWPRPNIYARFWIIWEGNDYGEIGAARVRVDVDYTSEFQFSSLDVRFEALRNLIQPAGDERTWIMQWDYEGNFDPAFAGEFWFQGTFGIDAFGNFWPISHRVRDLGTQIGGAPGTKIVRPGRRVIRDIPPIPGAPTAPPKPQPFGK